MRLDFLLFERVPDEVGVEHKQQVRVADQSAHLGDLAKVPVQIAHHLVEVLDAVLAWNRKKNGLMC